MELFDNNLILFIVAVLLSRYINSRAIKKLTVEKKAELIDGFSSFGVWAILPLLVIFGAFYFTFDYVEKGNLLYFGLFALLTVGYVIGIQIYIYKKLKKMDYPMSYIKQYLLSLFIRFVGILALLYPIILVFLSYD